MRLSAQRCRWHLAIRLIHLLQWLQSLHAHRLLRLILGFLAAPSILCHPAAQQVQLHQLFQSNQELRLVLAVQQVLDRLVNQWHQQLPARLLVHLGQSLLCCHSLLAFQLLLRGLSFQ